MEDQVKIEVETREGEKPGATAAFPYDRMTTERFRAEFPHARWRDDLKAWFVPGTTAGRRLDRWLGRELSGAFTYADERGRDAFAFEPIDSSYLEAGTDLKIVTPYSRTIVAALREVPWARWDSESRSWRVPYRSLEQLRKHWPAIEAAALRNEPHERRKRGKAIRGTDLHREMAERSRERRRRRHPVSMDALPPIGRVVMTRSCGAVVFTAMTGELVEAAIRRAHYQDVGGEHDEIVWAEWRKPSLSELVKAWPAKHAPTDEEHRHGWWQATLPELREARRKARSAERAEETRHKRNMV